MNPPETPKPRRRWLALSLRGMMIVVLIVGGLMGWKARQVSIQKRAVAAVRAMGGNVTYDREPPNSYGHGYRPEPPGPKWLRRLIGDDYFQIPTGVEMPLGVRKLDPPGPHWLNPILDLDRLEYLAVGWRTTDADLARLAGLRRLRRLSLNGAEISDAGMAHVGTLDRLEWLSLRIPRGFQPRATGAGMAHLGRLDRLELLSLNCVRFDGPNELAPLRTMVKLQQLYLDTSPRDEACLEHLSGLNQIVQLTLGTTEVGDAGLARVARMSDHIERLTLLGKDVTDAGLAHLARFKYLHQLKLSPLPLVTDLGLARLCDHRSLVTLDLTRSAVTDAGLVQLARLPRLARFVLSDTGITDAGLIHVGSQTRLGDLDLSGTRITDAGLVHLARSRRLAFLKLARTAITDAGVVSLGRLPTLRKLDLTGTRVTPAGLAALRSVLPTLQIITEAAP